MTYRTRFNDKVEQAVYQNSCDCLYYGYRFGDLNKCGLPEDKAKEIYMQAVEDMACDF